MRQQKAYIHFALLILTQTLGHVHSFAVPSRKSPVLKSNDKTKSKPARRYGNNNSGKEGANRRRSGYTNRASGVRTKRKNPPKWETEGDSLFFLVEDEDRESKVTETNDMALTAEQVLNNAFVARKSAASEKPSIGKANKPQPPGKDDEKKGSPPAMMMWGQCSVGPILKGRLTSSGWSEPTPVQEAAFSILTKKSKGGDRPNAVIASPTGSGKTLAFLLPFLCTTLRTDAGSILIVTPTMDLAFQIQREVDKLWPRDNSDNSAAFIVEAPSQGLDGANLILSMTAEEMKRRKAPIIAGTARSLLQTLLYCQKDQTNSALFSNLQTLILDEADRLL